MFARAVRSPWARHAIGGVVGGGFMMGMLESTASAEKKQRITITVTGASKITITDPGAAAAAKAAAAKAKAAAKFKADANGLDHMTACRPVVICGPSGAGKSTLIKKLMAKYPNDFGFSVSHTTRKPRKGEVEGEDYHFTTVPAIKQAIANGEFIESAQVHANFYGTSKAAVSDVAKQHRVCILDIDVQGVKSVQDQGHLEDMTYIFISPPDLPELERRLRGRGTETEESLAKRLGNAASECKKALELKFDHRLVNDDLDLAFADFEAAMGHGRCKCADFRAACRAASKA